jgi:hypothetical protein
LEDLVAFAFVRGEGKKLELSWFHGYKAIRTLDILKCDAIYSILSGRQAIYKTETNHKKDAQNINPRQNANQFLK